MSVTKEQREFKARADKLATKARDQLAAVLASLDDAADKYNRADCPGLEREARKAREAVRLVILNHPTIL